MPRYLHAYLLLLTSAWHRSQSKRAVDSNGQAGRSSWTRAAWRFRRTALSSAHQTLSVCFAWNLRVTSLRCAAADRVFRPAKAELAAESRRARLGRGSADSATADVRAWPRARAELPTARDKRGGWRDDHRWSQRTRQGAFHMLRTTQRRCTRRTTWRLSTLSACCIR